MSIRIITGDCVEQMRALAENSIDAIVTDPPYGLEFMGKEWDSLRPAETVNRGGVSPGRSERDSTKFAPVAYGVAKRRSTRVCSSCGKRDKFTKDHGCADAKWDAIYIDNEANFGAAYARSMQQWHYEWALEANRVLKPGGHLLAFGGTRTYHRLAAGLEDAGFEIRDSIHWVYGSGFPKSLNLDGGLGTALKPAHEPIVLARKALSGTVAATVAKYGTGALNVDASRVGTDVTTTGRRGHSGDHGIYGGDSRKFERDNPAGRWPPNFVLSHAPECAEGGKCAEDCAVAEMDRQTATLGGGGNVAAGEYADMGYHGGMTHRTNWNAYGDSGGASRFFPVFRYEAKPSRAEREAGLREAGRAHEYGNIQDGRTADGSDYARGKVRNTHPTVKPVALMAWLIELVTPKGGTVLDPFLGSGTTAIAAQRVGRDCIGIEREAEYVAIAEARIRGDSPMFSKVEVL